MGQYQFDLGYTLLLAGRPDEALGVAGPYAEANANDLRARLLVVAILTESGRYVEAEREARAVLDASPNHPDGLMNLGVICGKQGRHGEAVEVFGRLTSLRPNDAGVLSNLGLAHSSAGNVDEAVAAFEAATRLAPGSATMLSNQGLVLELAGRLDEAIAAYEAAVAADRGSPGLYSNYLVAMTRSPNRAAEAVFRAHTGYAGRTRGPLAAVAPEPGDDGDRPLRVGYVSPDFRRHAVTAFFLPLLEAHDLSRVHVTCYSATEAQDDVTARLRERAAGWRDIRALSDEAAANVIREDRIDVLVDLAGHTAGNRLPMLALKPALVQVSYLGYPNTTGLAAVDYRLTDAVLDPPGLTDGHFTERLWRLPRCCWSYRPIGEAPEVSALPADRTGVVTFGSFHHLARLTPEVIALWSRVLHRAPGTRLLIARDTLSEGIRRRLERAFAEHGVEPSRLLFRAEAAGSSLQLYGEVDVLLDTFPWSGHTTACDSVYMGVPVVTMAGGTHASRLAAGVMTAIGLEEMVAGTQDGFVEIAATLAAHPDGLRLLRPTLRECLRRSPLGDATDLARHVEDAFRQMWCAWKARVGGV